MRQKTTLIGAIVCMMLGGLVWFWSSSSAQDSVTLGFDVMWIMDDPGLPGDPCTWKEDTTAEEYRNTGIVRVGFPGSVTVADASGTIVYIAQLEGTYLDDLSCHVAINATIPTSVAYTIKVNGKHIATLPKHGGLGTGNDRPVVSLMN